MRITYVGGPRHGTAEDRPDLITEADCMLVSAFAYDVRLTYSGQTEDEILEIVLGYKGLDTDEFLMLSEQLGSMPRSR